MLAAVQIRISDFQSPLQEPKIEISDIILLPAPSYGWETWSLTL